MRGAFALIALLLAAPAWASERWVTLGAGVTETVFALGGGDRVVGVDGSSLYPPAADALPEVGTHNRVGAEAVLALRPTLVVASEAVGPPEALAQLRSAGVRVEVLPEPRDLDGALARVRALAALLDAVPAGDALVTGLQGELDAVPSLPATPRVAFVYARGAGTMLLGGRGSGVDEVVRRAGGALVGDWEGFRPITAEALVAAAPDVILLTTRGLESLGGADGLLAAPGIGLTPAGRARRIVAVDDLLLLTLGPRTGEAVRQVHAALARTP